MYQTFYSIVFKKDVESYGFDLSLKSTDFRIENISLRQNVLMIEANCTVREMIKYLSIQLEDDVEEVNLIIRNESFEPDWSAIRDSKE